MGKMLKRLKRDVKANNILATESQYHDAALAELLAELAIAKEQAAEYKRTHWGLDEETR